uniref:eukaryotic translation initiation factor 3 subunit G-like n=1 Tax=Erigeron canadensis TaxID=72917 RepID=UPI001CB8AB48|nr:eukaryotic translation initiation factor 3 subunit G-like [Erigeron canadensis]
MAIETLPAAATPQKPRWGELEEEDDGTDYDFLLPPKQIIGPDENGLKKVVEYKFDDDGNRVKVTTTTRVRKLANARLSKRAVERRSWKKFGDAVQEDVGARLTMVSTEEIILERPKAPGSKAEDSNASTDPLSQLPKTGAVLMVCRICGKKGEHWTSKCPYKDLAQPSETFVENPSPADSAAPGTSGPTKGAYVPPTLRPGAARPTAGADMRRRNDENSVRVNNLSEDTREPDLMELFRPFGSISRVYVAMDQKTGTSRGFGFVNFVRREEGERAIAKLNGYGYDNLILNVEWAAPRAN